MACMLCRVVATEVLLLLLLLLLVLVLVLLVLVVVHLCVVQACLTGRLVEGAGLLDRRARHIHSSCKGMMDRKGHLGMQAQKLKLLQRNDGQGRNTWVCKHSL